MTRRSSLALSLVALAMAALTCIGCGPPWTVMVEAVPNPFFGQGKFVVMPIDFTGLRVGSKSEAEYLSGKDPNQQQSFAEDKRGINDQFVGALVDRARANGIRVDLATGPQDGPFVIRPSVRFVEGGFYAFVTAESSKVEMNIRITTPDGRILDEFMVAHGTQATMGNPSSGGRLRDDGRGLGYLVASYIAHRVGVP
jgi:hypothetical protein